MKPVNGQIFGSATKALNEIEDFNGNQVKFNRVENINDDIIFEGEGSDGKKYSLNLQKKSVIVSISDPEVVKAQGGPVPEEPKKKESNKREEKKEDDSPTIKRKNSSRD